MRQLPLTGEKRRETTAGRPAEHLRQTAPHRKKNLPLQDAFLQGEVWRLRGIYSSQRRMAQLPFTGEWMSMSQEFTGMFSELVRTEPQISEWIMRFVTGLAVYCAVSIVFSGGWYTASATLFRRHPFLLGSVILYLAGQVAGFALIFGNFSLFNNAEADPAGMMGLMTNYFYVLSAIYAVLTPALYVFAYRRMKSAEV